MMSPMARVVSLTLLTVLIVFLGITFFHVVAPFLLPLFLAGVIAILCQPVFRHFVRRTNNRVRVAAGLTTAAVLFVLLMPLLVGILIASLQLYTLSADKLSDTNWRTAGSQLESELIVRIRPYLPPDTDTDTQEIRQNLQQLLKTLAGRSLGVAGTTLNKTLDVLGALVSLLIGMVMFVIALYYFLADGPALLKAAEGLIPVHVEYQRQLRQRFEEVVRAVVMATFCAAIAQGLATSVALYLVGWQIDSDLLRHFFIIGIIATFCSLVPVAGTWLLWCPCVVWCMFNGYWGTAIALALFGSVVIGTMDNVIRTYVLQNDARLHPLLAFISVLGGLKLMGLGGVFIGPVVAACLHALVQIFNTELKELSKQKFSGTEEAGTTDDEATEPLTKDPAVKLTVIKGASKPKEETAADESITEPDNSQIDSATDEPKTDPS